ncbi:MAG: hypothetical protein HY207_13415 [Nitrospirae bacterium]|nr:hypothetical protein [Nitrospirota bacterium]
MSELPHLQALFDRLKRGYHLSSEDEPMFSAVTENHEAYAAYFAPLGLKLVRHPREFFYFDPEAAESVQEKLPRIAVFSFILVDHAANAGRPIEDYLLNQHFLISKLPHFSLDRYATLLRQVEEQLGGQACDLRFSGSRARIRASPAWALGAQGTEAEGDLDRAADSTKIAKPFM